MYKVALDKASTIMTSKTQSISVNSGVDWINLVTKASTASRFDGIAVLPAALWSHTTSPPFNWMTRYGTHLVFLFYNFYVL